MISFLLTYAQFQQFPLPPYYDRVDNLKILTIFETETNKQIFKYTSESTLDGFCYRQGGIWSSSHRSFVIPENSNTLLFWRPDTGLAKITYQAEPPVDYFLDDISFSPDENGILFRLGISGDQDFNSGRLYYANHNAPEARFISNAVGSLGFKNNNTVQYQVQHNGTAMGTDGVCVSFPVLEPQKLWPVPQNR